MNRYIINLGTKFFNQGDIYNRAISIFEEINDTDKYLYGISFGNEFCEHLNIKLHDGMMNELDSLDRLGWKLFYKTSIITMKNKDSVHDNFRRLISLKNINFVINDISLLSMANNTILGVVFNRTRILIRKGLLDNVVIPEKLRAYVDKDLILSNQRRIYKNTFDNDFYKKFIDENGIKGLSLDIIDENINNLAGLGLDLYCDSHYTYVMSGRNCITHKIANNICNANTTTDCNNECYDSDCVNTNYSNTLLGEKLLLIGNTIFSEKKKEMETFKDAIIFYNKFIL